MKLIAGIIIISCTLLLTAPIQAAQLTFIPRLSASTEYTDNVDLVSDEDEAEDDLITSLSAGFTAQMLGKSSGLALSYDPSYVFYRESPENDGWRHNADFNSWAQLSERTRLNFRDNFFLTEDPISELQFDVSPEEEPLLPEDTTVRRDREKYYRNSASVGLNHQFGERDSFGLSYVYSILRNDDETVEDNDSYNSSAFVTLWFTPHFGTTISGSHTRGKYDQEDEFTGTPSDNFDNWNGNLRLIWETSRQLDTYIQFGYTNRDFDGDIEDYRIYDSSLGFDYTFAEGEILSISAGYFRQDNEESDDETGIIFDGNLGKTWQFKRGTLNFSASSGYNQSDFGAENLGFEVFYEARGAASYAFTKRSTGDVNGIYRRSEFRDQEPEREDDILRGALGINWTPLSWMSLRLEYSYRQVNSNQDENDYKENRGFFSVTLSPDQPYRTSF